MYIISVASICIILYLTAYLIRIKPQKRIETIKKFIYKMIEDNGDYITTDFDMLEEKLTELITKGRKIGWNYKKNIEIELDAEDIFEEDILESLEKASLITLKENFEKQQKTIFEVHEKQNELNNNPKTKNTGKVKEITFLYNDGYFTLLLIDGEYKVIHTDFKNDENYYNIEYLLLVNKMLEENNGKQLMETSSDSEFLNYEFDYNFNSIVKFTQEEIDYITLLKIIKKQQIRNKTINIEEYL